MIPPVRAQRLRAIERWMKDRRQHPDDEASPATELDELMMEAFSAREDAVMEAMIKAKTWGTQEGLSQFMMDRLILWRVVMEEFLPMTTYPELDD
jgi:hypothetical protein